MTTALSKKAKDPSKELYFRLVPCDTLKRKESLITNYVHFDNKTRRLGAFPWDALVYELLPKVRMSDKLSSHSKLV